MWEAIRVFLWISGSFCSSQDKHVRCSECIFCCIVYCGKYDGVSLAELWEVVLPTFSRTAWRFNFLNWKCRSSIGGHLRFFIYRCCGVCRMEIKRGIKRSWQPARADRDAKWIRYRQGEWKNITQLAMIKRCDFNPLRRVDQCRFRAASRPSLPTKLKLFVLLSERLGADKRKLKRGLVLFH